MSEPISCSYTSARLKLHYVDWGNPDAPPLILIHGRMDHCRNWDWVAAKLAARYHVIALDLRGHGDSEWSVGNAYSMSDYIYDVMELVEQLGLAPVTIIGHSLGGGIATKFTGVYPDSVKQLISIEGLGSAPDSLAKEVDTTAAEHMQRWAKEMQRLKLKPVREFSKQEDAIARMKQANSHLSDDRAQQLAIHGSRRTDNGKYRWKYDPYVGAHPPFDMSAAASRELWAAITCPVLLVWGKDSWASDPVKDGRTKYFKNARLVNISKAGHWVHHDQFDLFMAAVDEFLV